jgi:tetratricopeptide (TPR) repeat protein
MIWLLALQVAVGAAQHYEQAQKDFAQRNFPQAVSEVDAALHQDPQLVPALVLKARMATMAHRLDVAKSCLITAITVDPASEEAQFYLGLLFYQQSEFRLSLSPLEKAHTLSPENPLPLFYLAMARESIRDKTAALQLYQRAEDFSSSKPTLHSEILIAHGRLLLSLGQTKEGIELERRAIEIGPESREAHYELARGLSHEGDFGKAAIEAEQALTLPALRTSDALIHYLLATDYRELNQPALAKAHMDKFLAAHTAAP